MERTSLGAEVVYIKEDYEIWRSTLEEHLRGALVGVVRHGRRVGES